MYLHLGGDTVIRKSEIVGIFDIENTSVSKDTKNFLAAVSKHGKVVYVSDDMPKSFILSYHDGMNVTYISQISAATLRKRLSKKIQEFSL